MSPFRFPVPIRKLSIPGIVVPDQGWWPAPLTHVSSSPRWSHSLSESSELSTSTERSVEIIYRGDLISSLVWISNDPKNGWVSNGPDFKGDLNSGSLTIWKPDKWLLFCKNHLNSGQKHPDFEWSGLWMVWTLALAIDKARPFENRTIWNSTFKKSGFQMFPDLEWSDFRSPL